MLRIASYANLFIIINWFISAIDGNDSVNDANGSEDSQDEDNDGPMQHISVPDDWFAAHLRTF